MWVYIRHKRLIITGLVMFLCCEAFICVYAQPKIRIRLYESVCVDSDEVRLGDLAEIDIPDEDSHVLELEKLVICAAPQPGGMRTINLRYIQTRLYQSGLGQSGFTLSGAENVQIRVPHQVLSADSFKSSLTQAILGQLSEQGLVESDVLIEIVSSLPDIVLPNGIVDLSFDIPSALRSGVYSVVRVSISVNGKLQSSRAVLVKLSVFQDVFVANRRISMHEALSEDEFSKERVEVSNTILSPPVREIFAGALRASRTISEGKILTEDLVEAMPDAFRDDIVAIHVSIGNIAVETVGVLISDARIGDMVSVRNIDTSNMVSGVLIGRDMVCIKIQ
jgi:flagella basal body P-ring formation protein FlgA